MSRESVLAEWRRATRVLAESEALLREGFPEGALSRAYYAVLHGAKAALEATGIVAESHAAVRGLFGEHLVRPGLIERDWAKILGTASDERLAADYDPSIAFTRQEAEEGCRKTAAFVRRIREHLLTKGFVDADLPTEAPPAP